MYKCMKCGRELEYDDIGLHKRLIDRTASEFLCVGCLSERFNLPESDLRAMIERFRRAGCTLFPKKK